MSRQGESSGIGGDSPPIFGDNFRFSIFQFYPLLKTRRLGANTTEGSSRFFLRKPQIVNFRLSRDFGSTGNTAFSKIFARRKEQTFAKVAERMLIWSTLCESHTSLLTTGSSMASMVKNQEFLERIRKSPWENYPKKALRNSKVNISAIGSRHYWRKTHPNLWSTTSFKWPGAWGK